jgi:hypothetical protein
MSIELESRQSANEQYDRYRALSTSAVASLIVGLLSCLAILDWSLVAIPMIGIPLSAFSLMKIRRQRDELTGEKLARAGLVLSLLFAVLGPARLTYEFVSELPPGYERISYAELQPDPAQAGQQVPPGALELEGKRIFIKGFIFPGREKDGIRQFLLVRDQGSCCFGGNPKITDRIHVTLVDPLRLTFQSRLHKVGGIFHVEPASSTIDGAKGGVFYHLQADYLQ